MKFLLLLVAFIAVAYSIVIEEDEELLLKLNIEPVIDPKLNFQWRQYKVLFKKNIRSIWERNLKIISEHNKAADAGKIPYKLGLNEFSDWTRKEYRMLLGAISVAPGIVSLSQRRTYRQAAAADLGLPNSIDWRELGYVTRVKNQGICGSCWAFATVATLEAQEFNVTGRLVELSEKNLVDCTRTDNKCNPFIITKAYEYIVINEGIDTEASYPYTETVCRILPFYTDIIFCLYSFVYIKPSQCRFSEDTIGAKMSSYREISPVSENQLLFLLATVGPIAVNINAECDSFKLYKSGVFDGTGCRSDVANHFVTLVGYVSNGVEDYYIIKNSWGTTWGENGYMRLKRNINALAIMTHASYPVL